MSPKKVGGVSKYGNAEQSAIDAAKVGDTREEIDPEIERRLFVGVDQRPHGCWAACIASITGIPLDAFPDAPPLEVGEKFDCDFVNAVGAVLRTHGWQKHQLWTWGGPPSGWCIAGGEGPRGIGHGVVLHDGEPIWDPHPSRAGLVKVEDYEVLVPLLPNRLPVLRRDSRKATLDFETLRAVNARRCVEGFGHAPPDPTPDFGGGGSFDGGGASGSF